ncbi:MAG TPA: NAD(P)-binding domain-containing protein [Polyangia bacterium]|nr:NAD(P)-binding domain-containing protein [Polyangia bacterium]
MIRAAVLGADVSKSRSPAIHNAAYQALGVDGQYEALSVDAAGFDALARRLRSEGYRYLNVTIPHKAAAAALADTQGPEVVASGAANTLLFEKSGSVRAENTDGAGLIAALADLSVVVRAGQSIVMVGAGGAAAGAVEALTRAGARVVVVARRPEQAQDFTQRLPAAQAALVSARGWTPAELADAVAGATAVVSAVPAAAWADPAARAGLTSLKRDTAVLEMAYGAETPLGVAARVLTPLYAGGLGMLVHQAARAIELALGRKPPLPPLFAAARAG